MSGLDYNSDANNPMKKITLLLISVFMLQFVNAQTDPVITSWLQNTTENGSYYLPGNSTAIDNGILHNCQKVEYSDSFVYIKTNGIPSYTTGPFNNSNRTAESQDALFQIPRNPRQNTGRPSNSTLGNIGVFINGVAIFNPLDGVGWNSTTNSLCGGPAGTTCPRGEVEWWRDAVWAEREGFDCNKMHPANGNLHAHQNPSAFNLDLNVLSSICNLYDAEGLYAIDSNAHSPLIGYAYDGFPIYGAYGYKNADGTGGITRIKSGYQLKNITQRPNGPDVDAVVTSPSGTGTETVFLGYFDFDYEHISNPSEDYLDIHNGRFCVTPEYPNGTYAYFATVDENWNSVYPYIVGPTFYGTREDRKVTTIDETTTVYSPTSSTNKLNPNNLSATVFPNPAMDIIAIQINDLVTETVQVKLYDINGAVVQSTAIKSGSTIAYFNTQTLYSGTYLIVISNNNGSQTQKVLITK